MQPHDLGRVRTISDPRLHPDGDRIAFVVQETHLDEDEYRSQIWIWQDGVAQPFTHGHADSAPRWSPDGTQMAFVRSRRDANAKPQIAIMPTHGGESRIITDLALGAGAPEWSPKGGQLCVVGVEWLDELTDLDDEERQRQPRRIENPRWRAEGEGWRHDRRHHLYLVDPDGEDEPTILTPGDFNEGLARWHPDGERIAFLSARHEERHFDCGNQAWSVSLDGGDPEPLVGVGFWWNLTFSPDGTLHLVGDHDAWSWPSPPQVYRVSDDGSLTNLTADLDRNVVPPAPACIPNEPLWIDRDRFLILVEDRGSIRVVAIDANGMVSDVLGGQMCVTGIAPNPSGHEFAFTATRPTDPGELYWWDGADQHMLTDINADFRNGVTLVEPRHFTYESDGAEVDCWVYLPDESDQVPLLLSVHGGPAGQYGWYFLDEFQVYAGAGFGVVAANPRGSTGRGQEWLRAVVGVWHEEEPPDLRDLRTAVDASLERVPEFDGNRLGIIGGSYGAYIIGHILAVDRRFQSAIVERGLYSWLSYAGTSDLGTYFDRLYLKSQLPDGHETLWQASPLSRAHRITTPTLVIHAENDFRCSIEQAEQYFVALKRAGVESEFIRFPGEGHELSRSGDPKHRVERFEIILDWHERHLQ